MADNNITEEQLRKEIKKILKNANLDKTSSRWVRQKLEKVFDADLSNAPQLTLIDKLVMEYVEALQSQSDEDDAEASSDASSDYEKEAKRKPTKRAAAAATKASKKAKKETSSEEDEDDKDDSDDDEVLEKKSRSKKSAVKPKKTAAKGGGGGQGKGSGYTRAFKLSPALAELLGVGELPRHEVVKRVWAIIKQRNLYDPNNKRYAICDDALYKVIGTKRFLAFGMMKYLKSHFVDD